ncbi:MAG: type II secretion system protein GspG [Gemmatimonadota bacterium]|nr:type II secretion system protein GspG [Gemmatimonadota bacterium]
MRNDIRCHPRDGFTIVEILVAITIVVLMVVVVVPSMTTRINQAQVSSLQTTLDNTATGIQNYKTNVTRYPSRLQQLSWAPSTNRPYDDCGNAILFLASKWRGPYISLQIDSTSPTDPSSPRGLPIGDYVANDLLVRTPGTTSTPGRLDIQIPSVRKADWQNLNIAVDGQTVPPLSSNGSDTSGTVQWNSTTGLLSYGIIIAGC